VKATVARRERGLAAPSSGAQDSATGRGVAPAAAGDPRMAETGAAAGGAENAAGRTTVEGVDLRSDLGLRMVLPAPC
jgi:hypothetical protein